MNLKRIISLIIVSAIVTTSTSALAYGEGQASIRDIATPYLIVPGDGGLTTSKGILTKNVDPYWIHDKDGTYYIDYLENMREGIKNVDGKNYYFLADGLMQTGLIEYKDEMYYFGEDGQAQPGLVQTEHGAIYVGKDGKLIRGFVELDGKSYYFDPYMIKGMMDLSEDGLKYITAEGSVYKGWLETSNGTYYFGEDGASVRGITLIDNKYYYFNQAGLLQYGFVDTPGGTMYFDEETGLARGLTEIDGSYYLFNFNGQMQYGYVYEDDTVYYFDEITGALYYGWYDNEGEIYYRDEATNELFVGWHMIDDAWYYFDETGLLVEDLSHETMETQISRSASIKDSLAAGPTPELMGWQDVYKMVNRNQKFDIIDLTTGRRLTAKFVGGHNHMDFEPLTEQDTITLYNVYGGKWAWTRRPVAAIINGHVIAASINGMPHGKSDYVANNGMHGVLCIHFMGSRTHGTSRVCPLHQSAIKRAMMMMLTTLGRDWSEFEADWKDYTKTDKIPDSISQYDEDDEQTPKTDTKKTDSGKKSNTDKKKDPAKTPTPPSTKPSPSKSPTPSTTPPPSASTTTPPKDGEDDTPSSSNSASPSVSE